MKFVITQEIHNLKRIGFLDKKHIRFSILKKPYFKNISPFREQSIICYTSTLKNDLWEDKIK